MFNFLLESYFITYVASLVGTILAILLVPIFVLVLIIYAVVKISAMRAEDARKAKEEAKAAEEAAKAAAALEPVRPPLPESEPIGTEADRAALPPCEPRFSMCYDVEYEVYDRPNGGYLIAVDPDCRFGKSWAVTFDADGNQDQDVLDVWHPGRCMMRTEPQADNLIALLNVHHELGHAVMDVSNMVEPMPIYASRASSAD